MNKLKILFFHFDLGVGGAEKVLLNLINNLPKEKYDITLCLLFNSGVRKDLLAKNIKLTYLFNCNPFRGITKLLQLFSPEFLYRRAVKEQFDVEISYIEGIPARIISGSSNPNSKKFAWIHSDSLRNLHSCFRTKYEAIKCYSKFDRIAFVSDLAKKHFVEFLNWQNPVETIHNVVDTEDIIKRSQEEIDIKINRAIVNFTIVGRLHYHKSHIRLFNSLSRISNRNWHLYILGDGDLKSELESKCQELGLSDNITFLGFQSNPYKYIARMDAVVCSSIFEGFSTVATESMVLGIPFITTDCAGMEEIIINGESGIIVDNNEEGLVSGVSKFIDDPSLRKKLKIGAQIRGKHFSIEEGITTFENFIL